MIKVSLCILLSIGASAAHAEECLEKGSIRYRLAGQLITEDASYCFNEKRNELVSQSCKGKTKCAALNQKRTNSKKNLHGQFGSPGFKLCYYYKGKPQLIEFTDSKDWFPLNRCTFEKDGSFVDVGTFYKHMK